MLILPFNCLVINRQFSVTNRGVLSFILGREAAERRASAKKYLKQLTELVLNGANSITDTEYGLQCLSLILFIISKTDGGVLAGWGLNLALCHLFCGPWSLFWCSLKPMKERPCLYGAYKSAPHVRAVFTCTGMQRCSVYPCKHCPIAVNCYAAPARMHPLLLWHPCGCMCAASNALRVHPHWFG